MKDTKGLMLYFTSLEIFKRMTYEELGEYVAKEMKWLAGESPEPEFENDLQFCCHIRNKEIMQAKEYDRIRKQKGKDKTTEETKSIPTCDIPTEKEDVSTCTRKITEEDLEKIYEAEFRGSHRDYEWRVRETASKTGLTQDNVQNIYADFRNNKRQ